MIEIDPIKYIKSELSTLYEKKEVESFVSLLIKEIGGIETKQRLLSDKIEFDSRQNSLLQNIIERLKKYEPIQYILGKTEFYGLTIKTDSRGLIPRPETEELVDWIIKDCHNAKKILDICTGSGCIAICLAKNLPCSTLSALDISKEAISLAKENADINKVNINFYQADIQKVDSWQQSFDLIVSNPPYITTSEMVDMNSNVLDYEPHLALFVDDENPIVFYEKIARFSKNNLNEGGYLFFEINRRFGVEIASMLENMNFKDIILKKDIFGNDRFIKCKKK